MAPMLLIFDFLFWQYGKGLLDLLRVWRDFLAAVIHFFSIPLLLRTLFAPWKRMLESGRAGSTEAFFENVLVNIISRILGAFVRLAIVITGLVACVLMLIALVILIAVWLLAPIVAILSISFGFYLIAHP